MGLDFWIIKMPFVFLIIGVMLLVIGLRGQSQAATTLLKDEFTGSGSFIQWFIAIMVLGLVGYYKPIRPLTDGLIGLVILTMILNEQTKNNIFKAFETALQNTTPSPSGNAASSNATVSGAATATNPIANLVKALQNGSVFTPPPTNALNPITYSPIVQNSK